MHHMTQSLYGFGKKFFELLSSADVAYFCKDWEKYRGCKMEHTACIEYGIKTIEFEGE